MSFVYVSLLILFRFRFCFVDLERQAGVGLAALGQRAVERDIVRFLQFSMLRGVVFRPFEERMRGY